MSKILWKSLVISPVLLGAALVGSGRAIAADTKAVGVAQPQATESQVEESSLLAAELNEAQPVETQVAQAAPSESDNSNLLQQIQDYSNEGTANQSQGQVTNVSQFRDVQPTDWAYEALSRIVERYQCLQGYPDGTYRGNRALSRYEFAAGLNACLRRIEELIAAQPAGVSQADLDALRRLTEEFRTELATLGTRLDNLESRTAFLEQRQFSTTTKLAGEAIFAYVDTVDGAASPGIFGDRVRLDLRTSFTGRDVLHTRLAAGNLANPLSTPDNGFNDFNFGGITNAYYPEVGPTFEGTQTFNISPGNNNDIALDWLAYYFPFGSSQVYLAATGGIHSDYAATNNPYFEDYDGGNGALSTFAQENPIYRIGGGAGGAITLGLGGRLGFLRPTSITVGFLADNANTPILNSFNNREDGGLVNGDYAALGQLNLNVGDRLGLGLTYVRGNHSGGNVVDFDPVGGNSIGFGNGIYDIGGSAGQTSGRPIVGTPFANDPSLLLPPRTLANGAQVIGGAGMTTNSYGLSAAFRLSDNLSLSGFGTYTDADIDGGGQADIWSYGAGIALPNFGKPGNVLGVFAGVEPTLRGLRGPNSGQFLPITRDEAWHVEGFYKYQLTDNISITPGVIWLLNPNQNASNRDAYIGTLRTTFTF